MLAWRRVVRPRDDPTFTAAAHWSHGNPPPPVQCLRPWHTPLFSCVSFERKHWTWPTRMPNWPNHIPSEDCSVRESQFRGLTAGMSVRGHVLQGRRTHSVSALLVELVSHQCMKHEAVFCMFHVVSWTETELSKWICFSAGVTEHVLNQHEECARCRCSLPRWQRRQRGWHIQGEMQFVQTNANWTWTGCWLQRPSQSLVCGCEREVGVDSSHF